MLAFIAPLVAAAVVGLASYFNRTRKLRSDLVQDSQILQALIGQPNSPRRRRGPRQRAALEASIGARVEKLLIFDQYPAITRGELLLLALGACWAAACFPDMIRTVRTLDTPSSWPPGGPFDLVLGPLAMVVFWGMAYVRWTDRAKKRVQALSDIGDLEERREVAEGTWLLSILHLLVMALVIGAVAAWSLAVIVVLCGGSSDAAALVAILAGGAITTCFLGVTSLSKSVLSPMTFDR